MTHHTLTGAGSLSGLASISDQGTGFVNGDTLNTAGFAILFDINDAIFGAYNSDGPDGYGLNNSVYQPSSGDWELAPNVRVECRGNVNTRNIKVRGGNGSTFEVNSATNETRTFRLGDSETGVFIESLSDDWSAPFSVTHAGDGVGIFNAVAGANFLGQHGRFVGWGNGTDDIRFSIENSAERKFEFSRWWFSNKAPIQFMYTGLEGLSKVDVSQVYFERSDDPGHVTETVLKWHGAQDKVTQSTTQTRNWSQCTVNGIAEVFYPGGYTLDNWMLRDVRMSSDSDTDAASMDGWCILGLTADTFAMSGMSEGYIYAKDSNPHGWALARLKSSAVFRNVWFEFTSDDSGDENPDDGDGFLASADNSLTDYLNKIQVDFEQCGFLSNDGGLNFGNIAFTINGNTTQGGGDVAQVPKFNMRHCYVDMNWGANGVNADEVGPTPTGIMGDVINSIFHSSRGDGGYVFQTFNDTNPNPDLADGVVNYNARNGLTQAYEGVWTTTPGTNDIVNVDPQFVNEAARIATFDSSSPRVGPGTYENAVTEFLKQNTVNANDDYTLTKLVQYFQDGFTAQATAYQTASDIGGLIGPTLGGGGITIVSVNDGASVKHLQSGVIIVLSEPVDAGTFTRVRCTGPDGNSTVLPLTQIDGNRFLLDYDKGNTNLGFSAQGLELISG